MFKKIALFCALIGMVALTATSAYAEVQNIRISGDIQALGIYRNNYDLEDSENLRGNEWLGLAEDQNASLMSIIRLGVDADLTDNVSASIRLANLRDWDGVGAADDISVDLAYVTLKELFYSPLTLVIGRQELSYGEGMIIGLARYQDPNGSIENDDLSPLSGYDAVRAVFDYDPLTLDIFYAKISETDDTVFALSTLNTKDDDQNLYGANLGYVFGSYDAEVEGYFFYKQDDAYGLTISSPGSASNTRVFEQNKVATLGLRGSLIPLENLTLSGEIAGQWGEISDQQAGPDGNPLTRDREGFLADVTASYNFADVIFSPVLGIEYTFISGEEQGNNGDFEAWDYMFRSKVSGEIRDELETTFTTNDPADTSGYTNQSTIRATGSLDLGDLVDGLALDLAYMHYWFDEVPLAGADDDIGDEINLSVTYDYTEDVRFALDGAWFFPGDYYDHAISSINTFSGGNLATTANGATGRTANDTAVSVVGSVTVTF